MSAQPEALGLIATIESWWGERLGPELIDRIDSAPFEHLERFHDEEADLQRLYDPGNLPPLPSGGLRPIWGETLEPAEINYRTAAKLLLYVDTVVEDSHRLEPFQVVGMEGARESEEFVRRSIRRDLEWLLGNRPLIEDGSILFTAKYRGLAEFGIWDQIAGSGQVRSSAAWQMSGNVVAALEGTATPIAQSREHEEGYRELLMGHKTEDGRVSELNTLARIPLPGFTHATLQSLVALRASASDFGEWRSHLRAALASVSELPDSESAASDAASIVLDELRHSTETLSHAVKTSPVLTAVRSAGIGFGVTAVGATASAGVAIALNPAEPNLLAGAVVGAVPGAVEYLREVGQAYVEAAHARRVGKAVWGILGSFDRDLTID